LQEDRIEMPDRRVGQRFEHARRHITGTGAQQSPLGYGDHADTLRPGQEISIFAPSHRNDRIAGPMRWLPLFLAAALHAAGCAALAPSKGGGQVRPDDDRHV
jgi:hypothetical protein